MFNKTSHILIATSNPYIPQLMGGSERSSQSIGIYLKENGYNVSVLCALRPEGWTGLTNRFIRHFLGNPFPKDIVDNIPIYRVWPKNGSIDHHIEEFVRKKRPDIVLVQAGYPFSLARKFEKLEIPVIVYLRDLVFPEGDGPPPTGKYTFYVANSKFTAKRFANQFGIQVEKIIPPSITPENYRVEKTRQYALMVNPISIKGLDLVIELANRLQNIPFLLQESWDIDEQSRKKLDQAMKKNKNITLRERSNDMRSCYSKARVLLVPSQWEEAWGRVVSEAQVSGIPVIASSVGGLPESVGTGGLLVSPSDIDEWELNLSKLWNDHEFENTLSNLALKHAARDEIQHRFLLKESKNLIEKLLNLKNQLEK